MSDKNPYSPLQEKILQWVVRIATPLNVFIYRLSGGRLGNRVAGVPVLLLTTTGRKSGQLRTVALIFLEQPEGPIVVASKGGSATHPAWYLNLRDNPDVTVELGNQSYQATARQLDPDETKTLWPQLDQLYAGYESYRGRTDRTFPVIRLEPKPG